MKGSETEEELEVYKLVKFKFGKPLKLPYFRLMMKIRLLI
jgi:hypothetical protein